MKNSSTLIKKDVKHNTQIQDFNLQSTNRDTQTQDINKILKKKEMN